MDLETIVANVTGTLREEYLGGRKYLVAPVTLIVPGVLNGSDGPGYYPPEEVSKNPQDWNHFPIVRGHPTLNGKPVSARDPKVLEEVGLGFLYRSGYSQRLFSEAWFDDEFTKNRAPDTHAKLLASNPIEVSTGLFLKKVVHQPDDQGKLPTFNGKDYTFTTSQYKPDHLAVIEDGVGACSCDDGCGVFNGRLVVEPTPEELSALYASADPAPSPHANETSMPMAGGGGGGMPKHHAARIQSPDNFEQDSYRTKTLAPGLQAVMAKHARTGGMMIQAYHFDKAKYTAEQAKDWLKKHHVKDMGFQPAVGDVTTPKVDTTTKNQATDATANELSHDQIRSQLQQLMRSQCTQADPYCYVEYVFDDYFIYGMGGCLYRQDYSKSDSGVTLGSEAPVEVTPKMTFVPEIEDNMAAMNEAQRKEIVTFLTTNCDCWKKDTATSAATLNALTDEQLMTLHQNARAEVRRLEVEQAARVGFGLTSAATHEQVVNALKSHKPASTVTDTTKSADVPVVVTNESRLTPEEREAVDWARAERTRVRNELVAQLTANVADGPAKAQAQVVYQGMSIDNLRALAAATPAPISNQFNPNVPAIPMFQGSAAPLLNADGSAAPAVPLETEEMDWNEGASPALVQRMAR